MRDTGSVSALRISSRRASKTFSYDPNKAGSTNINFSPWSGSGGNPALEPYRANAYDLSIEKYFGEASYVALAAFYKDLSDWVVNQPVTLDLTQQIENAGFGAASAAPIARRVFDYWLLGQYPSEEDMAATQKGQTASPIGKPRTKQDVPLEARRLN